MKTALIFSAFFVLVGIMTGSRPSVKGGSQVRVVFSPHGATQNENIKSVSITQESKNSELVIELEQFRPRWASRAFPKVKFKAHSKDCFFIATEPMLFKCQAQSVVKTKSLGVKLALESVEATFFEGQRVSEKGVIETTELYAVDFALKIGRKSYKFRAFANPAEVQSI